MVFLKSSCDLMTEAEKDEGGENDVVVLNIRIQHDMGSQELDRSFGET